MYLISPYIDTFTFYLQLLTIYLVRMGHQPLLYLPLLCTARRCHLWHFYFLGRTLCILREPYRIKQASKTISDDPALGRLSVRVYFRAYFVMFNLWFIKNIVIRFSIHVLNKHTYDLKSWGDWKFVVYCTFLQPFKSTMFKHQYQKTPTLTLTIYKHCIQKVVQCIVKSSKPYGRYNTKTKYYIINPEGLFVKIFPQ